jgi:hypothetical protein
MDDASRTQKYDAMVIIYTTEKCHACNIAKKALEISGIAFEERFSGYILSGGMPIIVNSENKREIHGWPGSINKLKGVLEL